MTVSRSRARFKRGQFRPLVWPLALIGVGLAFTQIGAATAYLDGFRAYGQFQGMGWIVGVIGLVWLIVAGVRVGVNILRSRRATTWTRPSGP